MQGTALNRKLNYCNTNIAIRENFGELFPNKVLNEYYNVYMASNMMGITFLYNHVTNNTAINSEQLNNLDRLSNIKELKKDWDGYGSSAISDAVIERAKKFIECIVIQPLMFPTGRDSIQMQYELNDKSYLEFEIYRTKVMSMFVPKRKYEEAVFEEFTDIEIDQFNQMVKEFYGK